MSNIIENHVKNESKFSEVQKNNSNSTMQCSFFLIKTQMKLHPVYCVKCALYSVSHVVQKAMRFLVFFLF